MGSKDRNQAVKDRVLAKARTHMPKERPPGQEFIIRILMPKEYVEDGTYCSHCLMYDQNRVVESLIPITDEIDEVMKGHGSRYFYAQWDRAGEIDLTKVAPNQNW